jgi:ABC-2 type transport system permease protein
MLVVPLGQAYAASQGLMTSNVNVGNGPVPPGLVGVTPESMFGQFLFPLFILVGGLAVPSMAASYTVVTEREKRTVDLLLALPITLNQILVAKIGTVVALAVAITLPLLLIDSVAIAALGLATPAFLLAYLLLLLGSLTFSACSAVVVALLARDYRAANNLNGAFMGPAIVGAMAALMLMPPGLPRLVLLAAILFAIGLAVLAAAVRFIGLERLAQ